MGIISKHAACIKSFGQDDSGQMTVEIMVALPVMIIVAVIAVNALWCFSQCASFDRLARDAVRIVAASPEYGQGTEGSTSQVKAIIDERLSDQEESNYSVEAILGLNGSVRYLIDLEYHPTLFGTGMQSSVFGVSLPIIKHQVTVVVDPYKPGVIV